MLIISHIANEPLALLAAHLTTAAAVNTESSREFPRKQADFKEAQMETSAQKRRDSKKSLRVKVISLGNAEVGKVSDSHLILHQTP